MKFRYLFVFVLTVFLFNFASAAVAPYAKWAGDLQSVSINDGESINFQVGISVYPVNPSTTYVVKLRDSSNNVVYTFASGSIGGYSYSNEFSVGPGVYGGAGSYTAVVEASDGSFTNVHSIYLTVNPSAPTNNNPVITLVGSNPLEIYVGDSFVEPGYSASDVEDGDLTSSVNVDYSALNVNSVGSYTIVYSVTDSNGNSVSVNRVVNVVVDLGDAPVITLNGNNPQTVASGGSYVELGAVASDTEDGDLTDDIEIDSSAVNVGIAGNYLVVYTIEDSDGNVVVANRVVNVVDSGSGVPVIEINGIAFIEVNQYSDYNDLGASAWDDEDGDLTNDIVVYNPVNTSVVGTYFVTYNVEDSEGNDAIEVVRRVDVVEVDDDEAPVITVIYPRDTTYYSKDRVFKVSTNEDARVWYSLDNDDEVEMNEVSDNVFLEDVEVDYDSHTVEFIAEDASGNRASVEVDFKVKKKSSGSSDDDEKEEVVVVNSYYSEPSSKSSEPVVFVGKDSEKSGLGYFLLLFLGIGILIILFLIILIIEDRKNHANGRGYSDDIYEKSDSGDDGLENGDAYGSSDNSDEVDWEELAKRYSSADELYSRD